MKNIKKFRVAIFDCAPEDQKLLSCGVYSSVGEVVKEKIHKIANTMGLVITVRIYYPEKANFRFPRKGAYDALIIPGSRYNIEGKNKPWLMKLLKRLKSIIKESKIPTLGICFGFQALAASLGCSIERLPKEIFCQAGFLPIIRTKNSDHDKLFLGLSKNFEGLFMNFFRVSLSSNDSRILAIGKNGIVQACKFGGVAWGIQFHPDLEIEHVQELVKLNKSKIVQNMDLSKIKIKSKNRYDELILFNFIKIASESSINKSSNLSRICCICTPCSIF